MAFSEREIISLVCKNLPRNARVSVPAGADDAACLNLKGHFAVTSDIMFGASHFPPGLKPERAGRKAVVANISDLAAMGARPFYIVLSLGVPKNYSSLKPLLRGIKSSCSEHKVVILGGDTKCSKQLTISICAIGEVKGKPLLRSNAKPGDIVAVTGSIGSAFCGLHSLLKRKPAPKPLLSSFTYPKARVKEGLLLSGLPRAAAMDITDGLLYSASEIARSSNVRIDVDFKRIPISRLALSYSKKHSIPPHMLLNTGEDYELLVCLSEKDFHKLGRSAGLSAIGKVKRGKGAFLDNNGVSGGYDSFHWV